MSKDKLGALIEDCIRATDSGSRMRASVVEALADSIMCGLLNEGREESRGLHPGNCIQGTFPLPYRVLVIDLEPRVYRRYLGGHDVTDSMGLSA